MTAPSTRADLPQRPSSAGDLRLGFALWLALLAPAVAFAATDATPGDDWPPEMTVADPVAADLVEAGRAYLADGRLGPAVEVLGLAAHLDPADADANWLLATTLATIRLDHPEEICTWGAWPDVVFRHVRAAVEADPGRLTLLIDAEEAAGLRDVLANSVGLRALLDPSLVGGAEAHGAVMVDGQPVVTLRRRIRGRKARAAILAETRWYGLDADGRTDDTELDLRPDGSAVWATVHRDADSTKSARYATGRWAERRGFVSLVRDDGEVANVWVTLDGLVAPEGHLRYTDVPVDCTRPFDVWADLGSRSTSTH